MGYEKFQSNPFKVTALILVDKDILVCLHSSKKVIDADSDDENEMSNAAPDCKRAPSEMRNVMGSVHSYLDPHSKGEINNKMDDIKQCLTISC
ncbi:hypothetical protein TNCV_3725671 [Trichonephila clavipes]|nr:hypothetical protein TNCV_3725671 [Trichonephila clavipes]